MSMSTIRAQVVTIVEAVTGIGTVHDYKRHITNWDKYIKESVKSGKINIWEVTIEGYEKGVMGSDATERTTYPFLIIGRYAVDDSLESEKTFQSLATLVGEAFRDKPKLQNVAEVVKYPITCDFSDEMYGNVLCHRADIKVNIRERIVFG